ncbi:hypothetical protein D3C72_2143430 [compost metagenome]
MDEAFEGVLLPEDGFRLALEAHREEGSLGIGPELEEARLQLRPSQFLPGGRQRG